MSSNPKHLGPGYWANWHTISLYADTRDKKAEIARNIITAVDKFPCRDPCRKDAIKYIKSNPLLPAVESKDPLSIFKWTVNFHNYVNTKLNKTIFTWVEAKEAWTGKNGLCFENCGVSEGEIKREEKEEEEDRVKEIEIVIKGY